MPAAESVAAAPASSINVISSGEIKKHAGMLENLTHFTNWESKFKMKLLEHDLSDFLRPTYVRPAGATDAAVWDAKNKVVVSAIVGCLEGAILSRINIWKENGTPFSAAEVWKELVALARPEASSQRHNFVLSVGLLRAANFATAN